MTYSFPWKTTTSRAFALLAMAIVLASAGAARAGYDTKSYPATFCQQAGRYQNLNYYHGRAQNRSASTVIADCPVVVDSPVASIEALVYVRTVDRHYSRDIRCTIHVYDPTSPHPEYASSSRSTRGSGDFVQTLAFDFRKSRLYHYKFGPTLIGCSIPGTFNGNRSEIVAYEVREWETRSLNSSQ